MKRVIMFLYAAVTEGAGGAAAATTAQTLVPKVYTNEKIEKLKADKKAKFAEMKGLDPENDSEAMTTLNLDIYKIDGEIKAEIANMKQEERRQEQELKRQERVALVDNYDSAVIAAAAGNTELAKIAIGKRTPEQIEANNKLNDAVKAAREVIVNELLARYATSTPAKSVATGEAKVSGAPTAILEEHLKNVAAGMTDAASRKALEDAGHKRSTVWHTVNNYNKSK